MQTDLSTINQGKMKKTEPLTFRQELHRRMGMLEGVGVLKCNRNILRIEVDSLIDCDRILENPDQLCIEAIGLGFQALIIKIVGSKLIFKFRLRGLLQLSRMLD